MQSVSRFKIARWGCTAVTAMAGLCFGTAALADNQNVPDPIVLSKLNVSAYETQELTFSQDPVWTLATTVVVDGQNWDLDLELHSLRGDSFQVLEQREGGEMVEITPPPVSTYRGTVVGIADSIVSASFWEGEFHAMIHTADKLIAVQPMSDAGLNGVSGEHIVYDAADSLGMPGNFCGTTADMLQVDELIDGMGMGARGTGQKICEIGIDSDFEFYQDKGSNVSTATRDIENVINSVEAIYEAADILITYDITTLIVRTTDAGDPYTSTDAGTLLDQFTDHWSTSPQTFIKRDVAQLFSGKSFNGGTIGIAWLSGVCNTLTTGFSTVDINFSGNFTERVALSAHELGHNWSASHCDGNPECAIMCSSLGGCPGGITDFSDAEADDIVDFKNTRACLSDLADAQVLPFSDTFPSTTLSTTLWSYNKDTVINGDATSEPSAPNALNLDASGLDEFRDDEIRTNFILLSGLSDVVLEYFSQHKGVESGEQLVVEYYTLSREWAELERITSDGIDQTTFEIRAVDIPALGLWNEFRVRFRPEVNNSNDDWFIDNVSISAGGTVDLDAPTPNPMTFAVAPTPASSTSVTMTATTATDEDNPPVEYEFDCTSLTPGGTDGLFQASTVYTDTGLVANTLYTYRVRARDSADIPNNTEYSAESTTASAIETPAAPLVLFGATSSTIDMLAAQLFTNLLVGSSGLFFDSTTPGGDGGLNNWIQATSDQATGLSPDTLYTFQLKARNQNAVETAFGPTASKATLANVPGAPILGNADCDSMTVDVVANGNPSITTYAIQCTATSPNDSTWQGKFVDAAGNPAAAAIYQTDAAWAVKTVLGLDEDTTYTFQVTAKNQEGVITVAGAASALATDLCTPPPAVVDVTAPLPGAQIEIGSMTVISWSSENTPAPVWRIFLNEGPGMTFLTELLLTPVDDGGGQWHADWTVSTDLDPSDFYDIEIVDDSSGAEDHSGFFSLFIADTGCDGDVNGDGTVDPLDDGFVKARFGCPVGTGDSACDAADANLDGMVDPLDAGYVAARFGACD